LGTLLPLAPAPLAERGSAACHDHCPTCRAWKCRLPLAPAPLAERGSAARGAGGPAWAHTRRSQSGTPQRHTQKRGRLCNHICAQHTHTHTHIYAHTTHNTQTHARFQAQENVQRRLSQPKPTRRKRLNVIPKKIALLSEVKLRAAAESYVAYGDVAFASYVTIKICSTCIVSAVCAFVLHV
jgi:hypothetical protein